MTRSMFSRFGAAMLFLWLAAFSLLLFAPPALADGTTTYSTLTAEDLRPSVPADDAITTQQNQLRPVQQAPRMYLMKPSPDGVGGTIMPLRLIDATVTATTTPPGGTAPAATPQELSAVSATLESVLTAIAATIAGVIVWAGRMYSANSAAARIVSDLTADAAHRATLNEVTRAGINTVMAMFGVTPATFAAWYANAENKNKLIGIVGGFILGHAPDAVANFDLDKDADGIPDFIQARLPHLPPPDGTAPAVVAPTAPAKAA